VPGNRDSQLNRIMALAVLIPPIALLGGCPTTPCQPTPPTSLSEKSVVVHDPAALAGPFAFSKTMNQIVATAGGAPTSAASMLRSMLDTLSQGAFVHPVSGKSIPVTPRVLEPSISAADLLNPGSPDGMVPVGLFNRFDLAPADGGNCGEFRIVYAKRTGGPLDRMTMIFEARVPNPYPGQGIAGCAPITDFWAARSADTSLAQTIYELEKLYYQGIPGVAPIVKAENYGMPLGQLRVNLFKTPDPSRIHWSLREFLVNFDNSGRAIFREAPVDDSPTAELFRTASSVFNSTEKTEFRDHFLGKPLCNLVNPDRVHSVASSAAIINGIGAGFSSKFDDFESISQGDDDNPASNAEVSLQDNVQTRLTSLSGLSGVLPVHALNRAGAMTCGGCHQFAAGKDLGNGAVWPASLGFVHINEAGALSPLLNDVFVPRRVAIASRFAADHAAFHDPEMPCPGVAPRLAEAPPVTVAAPRERELYKSVDTIRGRMQAIIGAPDISARSADRIGAELPKLKEAIDNARKEETRIPGAFTPVRRSH